MHSEIEPTTHKIVIINDVGVLLPVLSKVLAEAAEIQVASILLGYSDPTNQTVWFPKISQYCKCFITLIVR